MKKTNLADANRLPTLIGQHFDGGVSIKSRLLVKMARFLGYDATYFFPKPVAGTIGQLVGAFLMQLVASPATRQAFAHLWSFGVPAIHNGDGTATPILDAWANKDTDVAPLTVDVGTQSVSAGDFGLIFAGTNPNAQSLVFFKGSGGSGGGGAGQWGDKSDGIVHLDGAVNAIIPQGGTGGSGNQDQLSLPNILMFATRQPILSACIIQEDTTATPAGNGNHYHLQRDIYCDSLTIDAGVMLITHGHKIYCYMLAGAGTISDSPVDYYNNANVRTGGDASPGGSGGGGTGGNNSVNNGSQGVTSTTAWPGGGWDTSTGTNVYTGTVLTPFAYGASAAGGAGGSGGKTPGGRTRPTGISYTPKAYHRAMNGDGNAVQGGSGGGSGAGDGANKGGFGGGGGGMVLLAAKVITFTGTIKATGQNGGAAAGGNAGGGGGGGGGNVVVLTTTASPTYTTNVSGGSPGAGAGSGSAGVAEAMPGYAGHLTVDA